MKHITKFAILAVVAVGFAAYHFNENAVTTQAQMKNQEDHYLVVIENARGKLDTMSEAQLIKLQQDLQAIEAQGNMRQKVVNKGNEFKAKINERLMPQTIEEIRKRVQQAVEVVQKINERAGSAEFSLSRGPWSNEDEKAYRDALNDTQERIGLAFESVNLASAAVARGSSISVSEAQSQYIISQDAVASAQSAIADLEVAKAMVLAAGDPAVQLATLKAAVIDMKNRVDNNAIRGVFILQDALRRKTDLGNVVAKRIDDFESAIQLPTMNQINSATTIEEFQQFRNQMGNFAVEAAAIAAVINSLPAKSEERAPLGGGEELTLEQIRNEVLALRQYIYDNRRPVLVNALKRSTKPEAEKEAIRTQIFNLGQVPLVSEIMNAGANNLMQLRLDLQALADTIPAIEVFLGLASEEEGVEASPALVAARLEVLGLQKNITDGRDAALFRMREAVSKMVGSMLQPGFMARIKKLENDTKEGVLPTVEQISTANMRLVEQYKQQIQAALNFQDSLENDLQSSTLKTTTTSSGAGAAPVEGGELSTLLKDRIVNKATLKVKNAGIRKTVRGALETKLTEMVTNKDSINNAVSAVDQIIKTNITDVAEQKAIMAAVNEAIKG